MVLKCVSVEVVAGPSTRVLGELYFGEHAMRRNADCSGVRKG